MDWNSVAFNLHKEVEGKVEGEEVRDEGADGGEGAEVEGHDHHFRRRVLGQDPPPGLFRSLHAPRREDEPHPALCQDPRRLGADSRRRPY